MIFKLDEAPAKVQQRDAWAAAGGPCVYFISAGLGPRGRVKIGKCSGHPKTRMAQLQTGSAERLWLEAFIIGDQRTEKKLHSIFASFRVHPRGEWFRREGELLSFLQGLRQGLEYGEAVNFTRKQFALEVTP